VSDELRAVVEELQRFRASLDDLIDRLSSLVDEVPWHFPVGTDEHPVADWYVATWHDLTGARNGGYRHSGIDINLDIAPWGDVDRGEPVWAVADGVVHSVGHSSGWLSVVVVKSWHGGEPIWIRYAHLAQSSVTLQRGETVTAGQHIGDIGNYVRGRGGDHLHFDMALDAFGWSWWLTPGVQWIDPLPVLKAHLDPALVDAMVMRKQ